MSLFLITYMLIFRFRDQNSALAGARAQLNPTEVRAQRGCRDSMTFGTARSEPGLTVPGSCVYAARRLPGFLNGVLRPAEPRTHSSRVRENGFVKICGVLVAGYLM